MRTLACVIVIASLALSACGGDATAPGTIAGTYSLQTVSGFPLPFTYVDSHTLREEVLSQSLILTADATFTQISTNRETEGAKTPVVSERRLEGSFTRVGETVTFTVTSGPTTTGTLHDRVLTITDGGLDLVYTKAPE